WTTDVSVMVLRESRHASLTAANSPRIPDGERVSHSPGGTCTPISPLESGYSTSSRSLPATSVHGTLYRRSWSAIVGSPLTLDVCSEFRLDAGNAAAGRSLCC